MIETKIKQKIEENIEEKINKATQNLSDKRNNYKVLWNIRNKMQKKQSSAFMLRDDEGNDTSNPDVIKIKVSEYYKELYENEEIPEGYEEYVKYLEELIKRCWNTNDETTKTLETESIAKIARKLETGKAPGPDEISNEMIKRGGTSMRKSIIRMMKMIYKTEEIPEDWNKAYIKNIYKGKGNKKNNE